MPTVEIALFDFCETLINKQTGDDFVCFALRAKKRYVRLLISRLVLSRLYCYAKKLSPRFFGDRKFFVLKLLDGYSESDIRVISKNYADSLKECIVAPVFSELCNLKLKGVKIYVVSGGYSTYIEHFMPELIDHVIANKFQFVDGVFRGGILGEDCMGMEKVKRIQLTSPNENVRYVAAYSDSSSDIPMLSMAEHGVTVSRMKQQAWARENGFKEIVWF